MVPLRKLFPPPPPQSSNVLGEDYRFDPAALPSLAGFGLEAASVDLMANPVSLLRTYHLRDAGDVKLTIEFRLCWNGPADAIDLLFRYVESFEREIPEGRLVRVDPDGVGDFGLAWSWDDPMGPEVVAFVRANALVTVRGHDAAGVPIRVARDIDGQLTRLRRIDRYSPAPEGALRANRSPTEAVAGGARVPLGVQPAGESWYFITTGGSANRDPASPTTWYFRAGLAPTTAEVQLFRVDQGLLPVLERTSLVIR